MGRQVCVSIGTFVLLVKEVLLYCGFAAIMVVKFADARGGRYSGYLLYYYQSTNTDAEGAACESGSTSTKVQILTLKAY